MANLSNLLGEEEITQESTLPENYTPPRFARRLMAMPPPQEYYIEEPDDWTTSGRESEDRFGYPTADANPGVLSTIVDNLKNVSAVGLPQLLSAISITRKGQEPMSVSPAEDRPEPPVIQTKTPKVKKGKAPKKPTEVVAPTPVVEPVAPETTAVAPSGLVPFPEVAKKQPIPPMGSIEVPEEIDVRSEVNKMIGAMPQTAEEMVGKKRPEVLVHQEPWYMRLMRGMSYGLQGKDAQAELDKVQERLDSQFSQELDIAKSNLNIKTQLQLKQLDMAMSQQEKKFEGIRKMWATMGEANPEKFMNDPGWWEMGAKAHHMPIESLKAWVEAHKDPETGEYSGFYVPKHIREWESKKYLANELAKIEPGHDMNTYIQWSMSGQWPDVLKMSEDKYKNIFIKSNDPKAKAEAYAALKNIEKLKSMQFGIDDDMVKFAEVAKKTNMPKEVFERVMQLKSAAAVLGPKVTEQLVELMKADTQLKTAEAEARGKKGPNPSEGMIKQFNVDKALSTPTGQVLATMYPTINSMGFSPPMLEKFSTEFEDYEGILNKINDWRASGGKGSLWDNKDQQLMAQKFYTYQKKAIAQRGYPLTAAVIASMPSAVDATLTAQTVLDVILRSKIKDSDLANQLKTELSKR